MSIIEVTIPDIGDAADVDVIEVCVNPGDQVAAEDPLVVLESDKASMDVPAPRAGHVKEIKMAVGDKANEGDLILLLETETETETETGTDAETETGTQAEAETNGKAEAGQPSAEEPSANAPKDSQAANAPEDSPSADVSGKAAGEQGALETIKVPDIGGEEGVTVIEITVAVGDHVDAEDAIVVLESDKASMEVPSPKAGTIKKLLVELNAKVDEGTPLAEIAVDESGSTSKEVPAQQPDSLADSQAEPIEQSDQAPAPGGSQTIQVPDIGGFEGVTIIELTVAEGDKVSVDDPLLVLESDKATMEVPSPVAGTVIKLLVAVNDRVSEGSDMAVIELEGDGHQPDAAQPDAAQPAAAQPATPPESPAKREKPSESPAAQSPQIGLAPHADGAKVHAGPAVRRIAREFGVDLTMVRGSGPKERILKEDVQAFVKSGLQQLKTGVAAATGSDGVGLPTVKLPDFSQFGKIDRSSMTRIHQLTAENMSRSWLTVPHVTQFEKADITELEKFRKDQKALAEKKQVRLTALPFMIKACAYAMAAYPQFNVSLDMDKHEVIQKHYVNIGVAVDTPGGLVVPVLRDVDKKGIWELAAEFADLAEKAKAKKIKPAEMQGGCFTISSLGSIGGSGFTPIVNTPEVAILGLSKAQIEPVFIGGEFSPRLMLPLCLSYDHRAINGADAARFTGLLAHLLGDIRNLLL